MGDVGLLLSLPTDSIAVRVVLASMVAVVAGRLLLRARLRSPRVRVLVALLPALAIAAVALGSVRAPALPSVWHTVEAVNGLTIPVRNTYLSFAPAALPLLLGGYAAVVAVRLVSRVGRTSRAGRELRTLAATGVVPPAGVAATVVRLAAGLRTTAPEVLLVPGLAGGAVVIGIRRPLLLVDAALVDQLDEHELEGVLAHELAHVARRDNLVAAALGVLRDVFFFVPAGGWSLQRLLREREHAADLTAAELTGRPGALAGGLLKVLEAARGPEAAACAPLLAEGTLVARVEALCDEHPGPGRLRRTTEIGVTLLALGAAVTTAVAVPAVVAGETRQRDALGLLLSDVAAAAPTTADDPRSTVFAAFDRAGSDASATAAVVPEEPQSSAVLPLDDPEGLTPQRLAACGHTATACSAQVPDHGLRLAPRSVTLVESELVDRWRLQPVVQSDDGQMGLFWLQRAS
jgi:Zn-dependent protease with chaperone function